MRSSLAPVAAQEERSSPKPSSARKASSKRATMGPTTAGIVESIQDLFERGMDAGMRLAFGKQPAQSREMGHAMDGMRRGENAGRAQIDALDQIMAEMIVEPRPPGRAQRIAGLQHAAQPGAGAAAHQPEMAAALLRHQFENDARLAKPPHAEHNAFIGPLHGFAM